MQQVTETSYMLPTITIEVIRGKVKRKARCLVDIGSQRTYIKASIAKSMYSDMNDVFKIEYNKQTFIGTEKRSFKKIPLGFKFCNKNVIILPILVDENLNLNNKINGIDLAIKNLKKEFKLADTRYYNSSGNKFNIDILLGLDPLIFLPMQLTSCLYGSCFMFNDGKIMPFGNIDHFVIPEKLSSIYRAKFIKIKAR